MRLDPLYDEALSCQPLSFFTKHYGESVETTIQAAALFKVGVNSSKIGTVVLDLSRS